MGETVCERRDGMGTTGQTEGRETVGNWVDSIGTENSRNGNKTPYGGMVDGGNRNQLRDGSGTRGRERKTARFLVLVPTTFSRTHFYRA